MKILAREDVYADFLFVLCPEKGPHIQDFIERNEALRDKGI
jgi:hypothetical protein